jgi:hypothetical protein
VGALSRDLSAAYACFEGRKSGSISAFCSSRVVFSHSVKARSSRYMTLRASLVGTIERFARKASMAVCSSQLRVVGACELCDVDHRQAGCLTPWWVVVRMGAYEDNFGFWDIDGPEEEAFFGTSSTKA